MIGIFYSAHEQYVLTKQQFDAGLAVTNVHVLDALKSPENLKIALMVCFGIILGGIIYFFFQNSKLGIIFGKFLNKFDNIGHFLLRIALGASLLASAHFMTFLAPEIRINSLLIPLLYVLGALFLTGLLIRAAAIIFLILLILATVTYGDYMLTYFNYFGEVVTLIIFGTYFLSIDQNIFGIKKFVPKYRDLELLLIRVTYGISVMYPAITIKLMHPAVIVMIVNQYHLNQIHWLFPPDPLLISLGTGLAQILVGVMIIIGFETRLASITTFFLYFLSVLYFREAVWPHFVLLALAFYLFINNGGKIGLDYFLGRRMKKFK